MSFTYKVLEDEYLNKFRNWFPKGIFSHEYNPGKFLAPKAYCEIAQDILDFEVRKDDVFMVSYPRTGSTWCQEIIWLLVNNLDYERAKTIQQRERAPHIDLYAYNHEDATWDGHPLKQVMALKSPRCIKAHCPYGLLPKELETVKPKIIYTMRNPKDTYCSYYSFFNTFYWIQASFDEAAEYFCKGKMPFGCFFDHCLEFWKRRHEPNILVLKYEDVLADTKKAIKDIATFLNKSITEEQVEEINKFVAFDNMKKNLTVNMTEVNTALNKGDSTKEDFIRHGKSGGWKNKMSSEVSEMFDTWIQEKTKGTDLSFNFN